MYNYDSLLKELGLEPNTSEEIKFLQNESFDSLCVGICKSCGTLHDSVEHDMRNGWCDDCQTQSVESSLSLKGLI